MIRSAPLRRTRVKARRSKPRRGRERDSKYLAWLRTKPCFICRLDRLVQTSPTEAAHVGLRGLGQKCHDREAVPLCGEHHRLGPDSHHQLGKGFWAPRRLTAEDVIAYFGLLYEMEGGVFVHPPGTRIEF